MRQLVIKNFHHRLAAVVCIAVGAIGVKLFRTPEPTPTAIIVKTPPERETLVQGRDLAYYEFGGSIQDCFLAPDKTDTGITPDLRKKLVKEAKACAAQREQARKFIIDKWENREQAFIILHYYCIDCAIVHNVFIEGPGDWRIKIRSNVCRINSGFDRCISEDVAYGLKLRKATREDTRYETGQSILIFLDKEGKEISSL